MITLNNRTYTTVRDLSGAVVIIVRSSPRMWRVASARDTLRVLRGLNVCPLRVMP